MGELVNNLDPMKVSVKFVDDWLENCVDLVMQKPS